MFTHAYDSYWTYAYPYDELRPLTCDGVDTWGSYSLTLIDALDTLIIMGNTSEYLKASEVVLRNVKHNANYNVSVFETNIRIVGGLLSAHLLASRTTSTLETGWPCSGRLLDLAEDFARKLLPAFKTATGMPYGTVNLKYGVPKDETPITCTAAVGTYLLEFGALSQLTGDPTFEEAASAALKGLWTRRSLHGMVGNHINVQTGKWTAVDMGIGAGVDSYFEYLVKGAILLREPELMSQFWDYYNTIQKHLNHDDWFPWVHMDKGTVSLAVFQSLEAFWPGLLAQLGLIEDATRIFLNYLTVLKQYGVLPEFYSIVDMSANKGRAGYPLRPELIESAYHLYRATGDQMYLEVGAQYIHSLNTLCRTPCGFAVMSDAIEHKLENKMESFLLAETFKYLYLLFDPDNFVHTESDTDGKTMFTPAGRCRFNTGGFVFNTEAHPIDPAALYCCSKTKQANDARVRDLLAKSDLERMINSALFEVDEVTSRIELAARRRKIEEEQARLNEEIAKENAERQKLFDSLPMTSDVIVQKATPFRSLDSFTTTYDLMQHVEFLSDHSIAIPPRGQFLVALIKHQFAAATRRKNATSKTHPLRFELNEIHTYFGSFSRTFPLTYIDVLVRYDLHISRLKEADLVVGRKNNIEASIETEEAKPLNKIPAERLTAAQARRLGVDGSSAFKLGDAKDFADLVSKRRHELLTCRKMPLVPSLMQMNGVAFWNNDRDV